MREKILKKSTQGRIIIEEKTYSRKKTKEKKYLRKNTLSEDAVKLKWSGFPNPAVHTRR